MSVEVFIHPTAIIDLPCDLGEGVRIWHFCHVMSGAVLGPGTSLGQNGYVGSKVRIGARCRIQNNVSLYDGVVLEDEVFVGPSVVFTNVTRPRAGFPRRDAYETTVVGRGASIGANATIRCGVMIGRCAFIAAGAVVTRSVAPFTLVAGVPARPRGFVCACGERLAESLVCASCSRAYVRGPDGLLPASERSDSENPSAPA